MTGAEVLDIASQGIWTLIIVSLPMMLVGLVVGVVIALFQALTQINDQTLTFVPKILAVFAALLVAGPWLMSSLVSYTSNLFEMLPPMVR